MWKRRADLLFTLVGREKKGCGGACGIRAGVHAPAPQCCDSLGGFPAGHSLAALPGEGTLGGGY